MNRKNLAPVEEHYYYMRDGQRVPRITVCLAKFPDDVLCRGVTLCSFSEKVVNKEHARGRARRRAVSAYRRQENQLSIERKEAFEVLESCNVGLIFDHKSYYNADPILPIEERLLEAVTR